MSKLTTGALVLYKIRPARITEVSDKISLELEGGKTKRVRDKDVVLLHPGPLSNLNQLSAQQGEVRETWELLEGGATEISEFSELIYGDYTPATAWAAWQLVAEGIYFEGEPGAIRSRPADLVDAEITAREQKAAEEQAWSEFIQRVEQGSIIEEDRKALGEVEQLALNRRTSSRILQALGIQENPVNAHRLLVRTGYWSPNENPYPRRAGIDMTQPEYPVPPLPEEDRRDLTELAAFAIDDEDNQDPDDAISLEGERIWVHVADVAALVDPDSPMDKDARTRGANLYLPDQVVPMLPQAITDQLGLGLQNRSPALSIGFTLSDGGEPQDIEISPTWLKVERISYAAAEQRLQEPPFATLLAKSRLYRKRRMTAGAAFIQLPEVKLKVVDEQVEIHPLPRYESREMITDLMLMAGEAIARYCQENDIPIPYATQAPPDEPTVPEDLAGMYAYRRFFKPTQIKTQPEPHAGLGLSIYTRTTSPLRRYSDLLTHQQLRAHLSGTTPLDIHVISERIAEAEAGSMANRKTERLSNNHWRLIYLRDHPDWQGEAVIVAKDGERASVLIPELGMDAKIRIKSKAGLNDSIRLKPREIDPPDLTCYFRVL
ncbi:MAG: RNB domain-containing ribonuclease [Candidatus Thiodiazotropha sp. (ex Semelilucina semeliformis)]|nr:RNB domain-containing ribonuclease [Candidatus Thiodiazotropha sp. (ex Semelilucina semeliformis)]